MVCACFVHTPVLSKSSVMIRVWCSVTHALDGFIVPALESV